MIKARDLLRSGGVVAIPTETVYGLAASIESEEGLRKIFSTKERPFFDPLIVHVSSFKQAQSVVR
ncbi:MAG: Sua5/YciO/YrdC/YwlC family protein, partial [Bdellovibrionota bacterium]